MLLSRPPLTPRRAPVRLACFRHAASVYPEPGSNSPSKPTGPLARTPIGQLTRVLPLSSPLFDCQRATRAAPEPRSGRRRDSIGYPTRRRTVKGEGIRVVMCRARTSEGRWPRHRPIVPGGCPPSIVGAGAFHDRVRDGNGWVRPARATEAIGPRCSRGVDVRRSCRPGVVPERGDAEPSAISTAPLHPSRGFHARPIDQLV